MLTLCRAETRCPSSYSRLSQLDILWSWGSLAGLGLTVGNAESVISKEFNAVLPLKKFSFSV